MFSTKLVEYLKYTNEEKQALDPNIRKQYDFQIREKVEEAISHLMLLVSSHSEDQLKKIFTDAHITELIITLDKALDVSDWEPGSDDPTLRTHIFQELKHLIPEPDYHSIRAIIYRPEALRDIKEENDSVYRRNTELSGEIDLLKSILETHGIAGDDLRKERYIHRNAGKIKELEESLKETHPDSDEYKKIEKRIETMRSKSWDMHKKRILKEINQLEEEKKKTNNTILIHLIDTAIQRRREQLE